MSICTATRRFSLLGPVAAAVIGLVATSIPLAPAKAQYFGFDVGPFGFGVGAPTYYYPPAYPYNYHGYYPSYYYPGYYPGYYYPQW